MEKVRKRGYGFTKNLLVLALAFLCGSFASEAAAFDYEFHGYLEANYIVRDTNRFENGFLDNLEGIQQRNTLKFDIDAYPRWDIGVFSLAKIHLTFRGAYDSIFDLRDDEYDGIPANRTGRFNYGRDDIKYECDLREAFVDIVYSGSLGTGFFRPGRQLVSWGEVSGATIIDRVNPVDASFMVSAFPDEMQIPVWMGRLNYSIPPRPGFNMNFDLLVIPDVRPLQLGPLDENMNSPYIRNTPFAGFSQLWANPFFDDIKENVPTDRTEYAARITTDIGSYLSVSGVFISSANDLPGVMLKNMIDLSPLLGLPPMTPGLQAPSLVELDHPWTKTYGGSFNYYNAPFDFILKGEFGYTEDAPVALAVPDLVLPGSSGVPWLPFDLRQYREKDTYAWMIGIDKDVWWRWLSPTKLVNTGFQWIHQGIRDLDSDMSVNNKTQTDWFSGMLNLYYMNGLINPAVFVIYDTEGTWMTNVNVGWTISKHWKATVDVLAFWGNEGSIGQFGSETMGGDGYDATDQIMFKLTYQW